jgi:cytochrome bd-type quinol oxidase subunit 2
MQGLELSVTGDYQGTSLDMLSDVSISVGFFTVALLAMHGTIQLYFKTEGNLQERLVV